MSNLITSSQSEEHEINNLGVNPIWYQEFVDYIDVKPNSMKTYKKCLRQFFLYLEKNDITQPVREDIIAYRDSLLEKLKANTVQVYMISVRQFFMWTAQKGLYPNVADHIRGARIGREYKRDPLTKIQLQTILDTIDRESIIGKRNYAMVLTMLVGGLRTITIRQANIVDLRNRGESTVLYIQGKGRDDKSEYIKIPEKVENALRAYLSTRVVKDSNEPLFAGEGRGSKGNRLTTRQIRRIVKTSFRNAGYDDTRLSAHSIRHTTATVNLLNGGSLEETQQLLRHSNINTTMKYAHHIERENNNSEIRILNAILD